MEIASLRLFFDVARKGSFAAVARERDLDPSAVSRSIAELEAEIGVRLFQRTTRAMALTEAGDLYRARVEPLIDELDRARDLAATMNGAPRGTLRFTASVTFGQRRIVPLLTDFRALYPQLAIECVFTDAMLDLVTEQIDLGVRLAPAVEGDLIATKLMDTRYHVVASPAYRDAHSPLLRPADLGAHRSLLFNLRAYRTRWLFRDAAGTVEAVPIEGDITILPAGSLLDAALQGLGPALLPNWLVDESLASGALVDLFPQHRVTATTFDTAAWLVYPSRAFLPAKVRAMIDFLKGRLGRA